MEKMIQDFIESSKQQWDEEYKAQMWDYLSDMTEYARYSIVYGYIRKFAAAEGTLDMGCGAGNLYDLLTEQEKPAYVGVDLSEEAIKIASRKTNEPIFHCADINHYTPPRSFNVIVFNESLQYVPNTPAKLLEYAEFLKPGGVIVTSLYSHKNQKDPDYAMVERKIQEMETCGLFEVVDKVSLFNHKAGLKWYVHVLKPNHTAKK